MGRLVGALTRGMDILELFLDAKQPLTAPDIVTALNLPRTTAHELISTLIARGYLEALSDQPNKFRLGVRVFQLGSAYQDRLSLSDLGRQVAQQIVAECGETVHVAVLEGTDVIYIAKVDSTHQVRMVSAVGRRLAASCTGVGKMLLSMLPIDELHARYPIDRPLPAMTPHSMTSVTELEAALAGYRDAGLAVEEREANPDVACVAAPVRDHTGSVVAAMSISVPTTRWSAEHRVQLEQLVVTGAARLSELLGYRHATAHLV